MTRKPASEAIATALIVAGRSGERASPRAAKSERSVRRAAVRRKNDPAADRVGAGVTSSASNVPGCSSISSNRITPSHSLLRSLKARYSLRDVSQRQVFYVDLVQKVFWLAGIALRKLLAALGRDVVRIVFQHGVE